MARVHALKLCICVILISVIDIVVVAHSNASASCAASRCGKAVDIRYPFWIAGGDGDATHCGYPSLRLDCWRGSPVLRLPSGDYEVTAIQYGENTLHVVDLAASTNSFCPLEAVRNFTVPLGSPLSLTDRDSNLTLFRSCPFTGFDNHAVHCMDSGDGGNQSFLFRHTEAATQYEYALGCDGVVGIPVMRTSIPNSKTPLIEGAMAAVSFGFELRWRAAAGGAGCRACEHGGGWCGQRRDAAAHGSWTFACFGSPAGRKSTKTVPVGVAVALAVTLLVVGIGASVLWIRARSTGEVDTDMQKMLKLWNMEEMGSDFRLYSFRQILDATRNFSDQNKLGEGGFGPVYRGQLSSGIEIAIKRLSSSSDQGFIEFKNEIKLIAKLQHRNLVRLLGCCVHGVEKMLVYEFLTNNSLDGFIFDSTRAATLTWQIRLRIVEGVAQGLLYLHRHSRLRVIHRDLKASNILLDQDMTPKISDFGFARIFPRNMTQANTEKVAGTPGYISPEYLAGGLFSVKSDVYSFGVLLLEIVTGIKNAGLTSYGGFQYFTGYAYKLWKDLKWYEMIDPAIGPNYPVGQVIKSIHVALLCIQARAEDRPNMGTVVSMLAGDGMMLPEPKEPAFFQMAVPARNLQGQGSSSSSSSGGFAHP